MSVRPDNLSGLQSQEDCKGGGETTEQTLGVKRYFRQVDLLTSRVSVHVIVAEDPSVDISRRTARAIEILTALVKAART